MNNGPDYEPVTIEIGEVHFHKEGRLTFDGLVNHSYQSAIIEDMTKLLPKVTNEFTYMDEDGLCDATLDDHHNLHWMIIQDGFVKYTRVALEEIMEKYLLEKYQQS